MHKDRLAFNLACYHAVAGDKPSMLRWVQRALGLGKSAAQFRDEGDFAEYGEDPDHLALLDTMEG